MLKRFKPQGRKTKRIGGGGEEWESIRIGGEGYGRQEM